MFWTTYEVEWQSANGIWRRSECPTHSEAIGMACSLRMAGIDAYLLVDGVRIDW